MIVRREGERMRLMLQPDHAVLAGEFAAAWGGERFRPAEPMATVKLAVEHHDDGWIEWEREPRLNPDTCRPFDFLSLPPDQHIAIYERGIKLALEQHTYAGLLVSLHGTGLHRKRHGYMPHLKYTETDPNYVVEVGRYLARQELLQAELIGDLRPDVATLWTHYRWLQAWDLLSLILAMNDPAEERTQSLGVLPHYPQGPEERLQVQGVGPGQFRLSPWPFAPPSLELVLPVRYLPNEPYQSDEDFRNAFEGAPTESLPVKLVSG